MTAIWQGHTCTDTLAWWRAAKEVRGPILHLLVRYVTYRGQAIGMIATVTTLPHSIHTL